MGTRTHSFALAAAMLLGGATFAPAQVAQEKVDLGVVQKIREEGLNRSQIPDLAGYLTDVIGPRLTGSPGMRRANDWTAEKFKEWGLQNVAVEPWGEFGRGWERVAYTGRIVAPFAQPLNAQPQAWTAGTNGNVTGMVVMVETADSAELQAIRGKVRGAFVLLGPPPEIGPEFTPRPLRTPADSLLAPPRTPTLQNTPPASPERVRRQREAMLLRAATTAELLRSEGALALLRPSERAFGNIRVGGVAAGREAKQPDPLLELIVAYEQYGQLWRNAKRGVPVRIELNVQNRFFDEDLKAYNTLADLPGTDKADELVMLGAHLDSWHAGTGATDNAAGSVVMMEAMRILKTVGVRPRRTIRIALWSGEEQGLLGSRAWVQNHKELWPKISAYVNVDNGTGRIRGIWSQSNERAIPIFEQILWPFRDLGVVAARHGNTGSTDHIAFDGAGIPGFNFIQDPIEYGTRTHHASADTYERLVIDDLKQAAVVVAATVYHLAMRDEMMPRKAPRTASE